MKQQNLTIQRGTTWDGREVNSVFMGNHPVISNVDRNTALSVYMAVSKKMKEAS